MSLNTDLPFSEGLEALLNIQKESGEKVRRQQLVESMESNEAKGHDCLSCEGNCCTFQANSMKVTPLEALDLVVDMINKGRWTREWQSKLEDQVERDRLGDDLPTDGKRDLIRRTYTCPFFMVENSFGCAVERWKKPYGCLAFNPKAPKQTEGGKCSSDIPSLEKQENDFSSLHKDTAEQLHQQLKIHNSKKDIPSAILEYMKILPTSGPGGSIS